MLPPHVGRYCNKESSIAFYSYTFEDVHYSLQDVYARKFLKILTETTIQISVLPVLLPDQLVCACKQYESTSLTRHNFSKKKIVQKK